MKEDWERLQDVTARGMNRGRGGGKIGLGKLNKWVEEDRVRR